ncbi:hypothetical protein KM043_002272 [Ampulex compressa]|nr:hypothetical protein KM043_002272 [Ampulex compressa]
MQNYKYAIKHVTRSRTGRSQAADVVPPIFLRNKATIPKVSRTSRRQTLPRPDRRPLIPLSRRLHNFAAAPSPSSRDLQERDEEATTLGEFERSSMVGGRVAAGGVRALGIARWKDRVTTSREEWQGGEERWKPGEWVRATVISRPEKPCAWKLAKCT